MPGCQIGGSQALGLLGLFHRMDRAAHLGKKGETGLVFPQQRQGHMDGAQAQFLCHKPMGVKDTVHLMGLAKREYFFGQRAIRFF